MTPDELRVQFLDLLDKEELEQVYQQYIENNTRLVPREFVQNHGIHFSMVLRKVPFGADFKSDLFYLSKSSDDWNAVFVELEKPQSKFFKGSTTEFHSDFLKAVQQINQWRAWFLEEGNQRSFLNGSLNSILLPIGMARNPTYNKFVLVFGRRREYESNAQRRALVKAIETDDFKVITYDSLVEGLEQKCNLYLGVRLNDHIKIVSNELINEYMFSWVDPTQFSVSDTLHAAIVAATPSNIRRNDESGSNVDALAFVARKLRRH